MAKKAPPGVLFCGVRQSFTPPGIASVCWVWYLTSKLFRCVKLIIGTIRVC
ncbi:MAG TPA: transcriptional regulator [Franconibacter pulveris]|nr:transcriptional regulator [Franconibacter pulveris]